MYRGNLSVKGGFFAECRLFASGEVDDARGGPLFCGSVDSFVRIPLGGDCRSRPFRAIGERADGFAGIAIPKWEGHFADDSLDARNQATFLIVGGAGDGPGFVDFENHLVVVGAVDGGLDPTRSLIEIFEKRFGRGHCLRLNGEIPRVKKLEAAGLDVVYGPKIFLEWVGVLSTNFSGMIFEIMLREYGIWRVGSPEPRR